MPSASQLLMRIWSEYKHESICFIQGCDFIKLTFTYRISTILKKALDKLFKTALNSIETKIYLKKW